MENISISININPFLFKYGVKAFISVAIWILICDKVNKDDFVKPISYIVGIISFIIALMISLSGSMNVYSLFFFIGGMQMLLYPMFVLEYSNGDTLGANMIIFWMLEVTIPLIIYLYFNPNILI